MRRAALDLADRLFSRRAAERLAVLAKPGFYRYLARVALPTYLEQERSGLLRERGVVIHPTARISEPSLVTLGAHSSVGADCDIRPLGQSIRIGANVLVAQRVSIMGSNHRFDDRDVPIRIQGSDSAPVEIEDDVWLGCGSVVLPGVTVGRGSVVAAGSVVTRSVPPGVVVAGVPARVLRARGAGDARPARTDEAADGRPARGDELAVLNVTHVTGYPRRMEGSNRSLLAMVKAYPAHVRANLVVAEEGEVAEAFRQQGVPVSILPLPEQLGRLGGEALRWGIVEKGLVGARQYLPTSLRLRTLLTELRTDIVHANDPRATLLVGPAARSLGLPFVSHLRGERSFDGPAWRAAELLPHRIVGVSDAAVATLSTRARPKAITIHNGVHPAAPGPTVPWLETLRARGTIVVATFATLAPCKGAHHLVAAVAALAARRPERPVAFFWIGATNPDDHDYEAFIREEIGRLGLANLTLAGWQADPFPFYRSVDLVAFPAVTRERLRLGGRERDVRGHEGLPRTILESMAYGLPVVAADVPGVRESVVEGETGRIVPPGDPARIAEALHALVDDAGLRCRMAEAARARAAAVFSIERCARRMAEVYEEVASTR